MGRGDARSDGTERKEGRKQGRTGKERRGDMCGMRGIPSGTLFMEMNNNAELRQLPGKGEGMTERGRERERERERRRE